MSATQVDMPHVRRCLNVQCRVETFKAFDMLPMSGCPVCLTPGGVEARDE